MYVSLYDGNADTADILEPPGIQEKTSPRFKVSSLQQVQLLVSCIQAVTVVIPRNQSFKKQLFI